MDNEHISSLEEHFELAIIFKKLFGFKEKSLFIYSQLLRDKKCILRHVGLAYLLYQSLPDKHDKLPLELQIADKEEGAHLVQWMPQMLVELLEKK